MIKNKPLKFTAIQEDIGTTIATSLWEQAKAHVNYINASRPLGVLMFFENTQSGLLASPDARFWQFCDGSPVSNPDSPLFGNNVPDCRGKFFRQAQSGETVGTTHNSDTSTWTHSHGGSTGSTDDASAINNGHSSTTGASNPLPQAHAHTISSQSLSITNVPVCFELQVYMRIL